MSTGIYVGTALHCGDRIVAVRTADQAPSTKDHRAAEAEAVRDWQPGDRIRTIRDINRFNRARRDAERRRP
jgi:hypothetical protein